MEKTGAVELTQEDLSLFSVNVVSDRIKRNWGFSLPELTEVINSESYVVVDLPHNNS